MSHQQNKTIQHALRVLLVDDHVLVRDGIAAYLNNEDGIDVVGYASNGVEAIEQCKTQRPDVVLMDISMPVMDGLEATAILKHAVPTSHVLVLSLHNEAEYVRQIMQSGALGYVLKDASFDELLTAIQTVAQGNSYFSAGVTAHLFTAPDTPAPETSPLTPRELQLLQDIAEGLANKQIANKRHLAVRTVETHRHNIKQKLDIHTTAGLTTYWLSMHVP